MTLLFRSGRARKMSYTVLAFINHFFNRKKQRDLFDLQMFHFKPYA
jgi:hypothetical protein